MKKNGEYVGIDEKFIPENEKYVDESLLGDKEKAKKVAKRFGIGYLCFFFFMFALVIGIMIFGITKVIKVTKNFGNGTLFNKSVTNSLFEQYQGSTPFADSALDDVITNNKKYSDHIITVVYNGKTATEEDDILAIKNTLTDSRYEVSLDYDAQGCVNRITIKDIKKVQTASSFNFDIESIQGKKMGADWRLDQYVIPSNKKNNEHVITVVYKETTATTEDEILALEKLLDKWTDYYYSLDYDSEGFINKITIKDI